MKNKALLFFALCMFSSGWIHAQDEGAGKSFTLEQAIEFALQNSINVKNAALDERIAKAKVGEVRATGLPQVNGDVQLVHNNQLPRFFTNYSNQGGFIDLDSLSKAKLKSYDGKTIAVNNIFQLKNSGDAKLSVSQLIFNGSYFVGLKAAKTYKELSSKSTEQTKIQTTEAVTKAFYSVLINNERMKLFDANIARVDSLLRDTKALNVNGFAEKIDVDRIKVSLNNLITEREKFRNLQDLGLELLKFQMNFPMNEEIAIVGSIENIKLDSVSLESPAVTYSNRIEYSLLETQHKLQRLNVKNNYVGYLPTISAFGNFGYSTQSATFEGLFSTQTNPLPEGFEEGGIGRDKWYAYEMVGLSLTLPIFDGFKKHHLTQQAKLEQAKVENNFQQLKSSIDLQVNQADITLKNSIKTVNAQKENVELATEVARVTKIKYQAGVGSNLEVTEAESALREAQTNYYNALYDAIIAQIDLETALGTLVK
ncbi:MAG TPA: TolC family protein [Cytophagales bacterium]|nr:TolC family protein [Cytophagales bacterium]